REQVADMGGALVLEEGARAVTPQRVGIVRGGLRLRHRHLHRLVAGLRGRILDRGERRLLAERRETVERRAAAAKGRGREQGCGKGETVERLQGDHEHYSSFRGLDAGSA